jgi:hypothetical protein
LDDIADNKDLTPLEKKAIERKVDEEWKTSSQEKKQPYLDRAKKKMDTDGLKDIKKSMPQFDWNTNDE